MLVMSINMHIIIPNTNLKADKLNNRLTPNNTHGI